jgi:hypothetical protein
MTIAYDWTSYKGTNSMQRRQLHTISYSVQQKLVCFGKYWVRDQLYPLRRPVFGCTALPNQQPAGEGKAHPNIAFAVSYRTQEQANQTMENYFEWWSLVIMMDDGLHAANQIRQNTVRQIQESSSRLLVTHADNTQTTSNDIISMHQTVRPSMMQIDTY